MDPINQQISEEKVEAIVQSRLSDKLKPVVIAVLILYLLLLPFAIFLINNPYLFGLIFQKNTAILCPIDNVNCKEGKPAEFEDAPAVVYSLPEQSKVTSVSQIIDSQQFILPPYTKDDPIGLNQSFIIGDSCYTITYTVPSSSSIEQLGVLPLTPNTPLISLGSDSIKIGNSNVNLILQLQKRPIDPSLKDKTDVEKCPVYNLKQQDFGTYEEIKSSTFQNR